VVVVSPPAVVPGTVVAVVVVGTVGTDTSPGLLPLMAGEDGPSSLQPVTAMPARVRRATVRPKARRRGREEV
jgi:mRNA-degrading endonuclease toxin of MazEF toxin-antitoxin module